MSEFYRGNGEVIKEKEPEVQEVNPGVYESTADTVSSGSTGGTQFYSGQTAYQEETVTRGVTFEEPADTETIKVVVDDGTTCRFCGNTLNPGDRFCRKCGSRAFNAAQTERTHTYARTDSQYTRHGYVRQTYRETAHGLVPEGYKNKYVSFLLCLFLGVIGVHHFYEGKIAKGLVWLFTGGLFGVGYIVDVIIRFVRLFSKDEYFLP